MEKNSLTITLPNQTLRLTFTVLSFLSFAIPFLLAQPQILVGTIINACLFWAAMFFPQQFIYPLIFFPSLAVLSRGLIFGPFTPFLLILIPFIWSANWILVFSFRRGIDVFKSEVFSFIAAAVLKSSFLFLNAFILIKLKILPQPFLISMGQVQLMTALLGGTSSILIKNFLKFRKFDFI